MVYITASVIVIKTGSVTWSLVITEIIRILVDKGSPRAKDLLEINITQYY